MSDQFLGEIRVFPGSYAPRDWATCDGQSLQIAQYPGLYSLLGTTYGGDGRSTFNLPNLQGRAALSSGQGSGLTQRYLGQAGGEAAVTLQQNQMAGHSHGLSAGVRGAIATATPSVVTYLTSITEESKGVTYASGGSGTVPMSGQAIQTAGGGAPHNNMQPYLGMLFCIALVGVFPPRP